LLSFFVIKHYSDSSGFSDDRPVYLSGCWTPLGLENNKRNFRSIFHTTH
jgi:hypothetical protein